MATLGFYLLVAEIIRPFCFMQEKLMIFALKENKKEEDVVLDKRAVTVRGTAFFN